MPMTQGRALTEDEAAEAGNAIREMAIEQTLAGMRGNPAAVQMVRDLLADAPPDFDPENDQLALALRRYDEEQA